MMRLHNQPCTGLRSDNHNKYYLVTAPSLSIHAQRSVACKRSQATTAASATAAVGPVAHGRNHSVGASCMPLKPSQPSEGIRCVSVKYRDQAKDAQDSKVTGSQAGVLDDAVISSSEAAAYNELTTEAAAQQTSSQLTTPDNTPTESMESPTQSVQDAFSELFPVEPPKSSATGVDGADSTDIPSAMPTPHGTHASSGVAWQKDKSIAGLKPKQSSADKLKAKLDDMSSKYKALDSRLDSLESTLVNLLHTMKQKAKSPAGAAEVGPQGQGGSDVAGAISAVELPEFEYDPDEEDKEGGMFDLKKLQTSLTENINRGYLESVKRLRELLMAYEWHLHGKELAERKGVAEFEKYCAEKELDIDFEAISKLYQNPNDLSHLPNNRTRLLARSIIQTAVDERYCSIYFECTNTAKELAHTGLKDLIPDSAGKVGGVIKDVLPLPGFLKK